MACKANKKHHDLEIVKICNRRDSDFHNNNLKMIYTIFICLYKKKLTNDIVLKIFDYFDIYKYYMNYLKIKEKSLLNLLRNNESYARALDNTNKLLEQTLEIFNKLSYVPDYHRYYLRACNLCLGVFRLFIPCNCCQSHNKNDVFCRISKYQNKYKLETINFKKSKSYIRDNKGCKCRCSAFRNNILKKLTNLIKMINKRKTDTCLRDGKV